MSVSGLSRQHRHIARLITTQAALLGLKHAPEIHYSEGSNRWDGIVHDRVAMHGQYPVSCDCSAYGTWCYWNSLKLVFGLEDVVNGDNWAYGNTTSMREHGRRVEHVSKVLHADSVHYDDPNHTAIIVGHKNGVPMVVSQGNEAGPLLLPYNYRPVAEIRRYI